MMYNKAGLFEGWCSKQILKKNNGKWEVLVKSPLSLSSLYFSFYNVVMVSLDKSLAG